MWSALARRVVARVVPAARPQPLGAWGSFVPPPWRPAKVFAQTPVRSMNNKTNMTTRRKLGRTTSHRLAMLRNMATSLIKHERIRTTTAKAKTIRPYTEKLIKWAKRGTLHDKKLAAEVVREQVALMKLFNVLGPRYAERNGGYIRIVKLAQYRKGDGAHMSLVEFVDRPGELRVPRKPRNLQEAVAA